MSVINQVVAWLQAKFLERGTVKTFTAFDANGQREVTECFAPVTLAEFHDWLLSIGAPLAPTVEECRNRGWIDLMGGGRDVRKHPTHYWIRQTVCQLAEAGTEQRSENSQKTDRPAQRLKHYSVKAEPAAFNVTPQPVALISTDSGTPYYLTDDYKGPMTAEERRELLHFLGMPPGEQEKYNDAGLDAQWQERLRLRREIARTGKSNILQASGSSFASIHSAGIVDAVPGRVLAAHQADLAENAATIRGLEKALARADKTQRRQLTKEELDDVCRAVADLQRQGVIESPPARDPALEARDKWLYAQCCELVPYKSILRRLSADHSEWPQLESVNGVKNAVAALANRLGLPQAPRRQRGRRAATQSPE